MILSYEEIDREEWSRLVRTSATGTWFQTPEAYCFYESMPEFFRPFVVAVERVNDLTNERTLRGVCVGYVTKEKNAITQYFTRRAIIIGGPALADDASSEEVELLMNGVKELMSERINGSPIYIETRNFNDYSRWKEAFEKAGFEYQKHLNFHVDCTDKEAMWDRMSENRKRQIKRVTNEGVKELTSERLTSEGVTEQDVREWYEILKELYRTKVRTPLWPVEFFLEAYRQGVGKFMIVRHEGKIIGGSMVVVMSEGMNELRNEGCVYEWFECGMNVQYKDQYPSVCATYAGMCYAAENGMARYDMMGAGEPGVPYGVRDFKAEFGGKMVEHGRFEYICKPLLYKIGTIGVKVLKKFKI
jgi:hypothetical protein